MIARSATSEETIEPREKLRPHEDGGDDYTIYSFGHRAGASEGQAVRRVVFRYYAAAAAENGRVACSLLWPATAAGIGETESRLRGVSPQRRAAACAGLLTGLFRNNHLELAGPIKVTSVRTKGGRALALLSSPALPYLYTSLRRYGRSWRLMSTMGTALP